MRGSNHATCSGSILAANLARWVESKEEGADPRDDNAKKAASGGSQGQQPGHCSSGSCNISLGQHGEMDQISQTPNSKRITQFQSAKCSCSIVNQFSSRFTFSISAKLSNK
jgi:hypothetical protein